MQVLFPNPDTRSEQQEIQRNNSQLPTAVSQHPIRTRLHDNIVKPKEFTDGTIRYSDQRGFGGSVTARYPTTALSAQAESVIQSDSVIQHEPAGLEEDLGHPKWKQSMDEEYLALMKNDT